MDSIRRTGARAAAWWSARSPTLHWSVGGAALGVVLGLVIAIGVTALSGDGGATGEDGPVVVIATPTPAPAASPSATPRDGSGPLARPGDGGEPADPPDEVEVPVEPTATEPPGTPTVGSLRELREAYGEAPDATLGRFRIPVLGVDAPLGQRFVAGTTMPNPTGPGDVVWYDLSQWDGLGGVPGGGGNAIFSGHVDYFAPVAWADADYSGQGIFFNLGVLSPGDVIEVEVGSNVFQYSVVCRQQVSAGPDGDWNSILDGDVAVDSITLITCRGDFDLGQRSYQERVVIRAERV